jgi:uncharacterized membrane protein
MNPFDWKTLILAKHAQHVLLIHFPIALFVVGVVFDVAAQRWRRQDFELVAYFNLLVAAIFTAPTVITGLLAWQWLLEGHRLKGILLYHMFFAVTSGAIILWSWWLHFRTRRNSLALPPWHLLVEFTGVVLLLVTGHLGGFLSGVNGAN